MTPSASQTEPVEAVLFDFAGTLLVPVPAVEWLEQVTGERDDTRAGRYDAAGRPGGPEPTVLPDELAEDYARRDVSPELHARVYTELIAREAGFALGRALYEAAIDPAGWTPYPDTAPVLRALREGGVRTAVVSNVGFDLPALFAGHGLAGLIDEFVLSYELGAMKPAAELFQAALDRLGVAPERALMVGDNPRADAGGVDLGIRTLLLPYSPPGRPHGLDAVRALALGPSEPSPPPAPDPG